MKDSWSNDSEATVYPHKGYCNLDSRRDHCRFVFNSRYVYNRQVLSKRFDLARDYERTEERNGTYGNEGILREIPKSLTVSAVSRETREVFSACVW
jgi:hypothetical protein